MVSQEFNVFQTHQTSQDSVRISDGEDGFRFSFHTLSMNHLHHFFAFTPRQNPKSQHTRAKTTKNPRTSKERCPGTTHWSGWRDLNPRPLRPERSALPSCATPRAFPTIAVTGREEKSAPHKLHHTDVLVAYRSIVTGVYMSSRAHSVSLRRVASGWQKSRMGAYGEVPKPREI